MLNSKEDKGLLESQGVELKTDNMIYNPVSPKKNFNSTFSPLWEKHKKKPEQKNKNIEYIVSI